MVTKFQSRATKQGEMFAETCLMALKMAGFDITNRKYRIEEVGIEIDAIANGENGQGYAFEFKGSWNINRPGARRTDTLKKAIANGALFLVCEEAEIMPPIIVVTSHLPESGAGQRMLNAALKHGLLLDVLLVTDGDRLQWYSQANAEDIEIVLDIRKDKIK